METLDLIIGYWILAVIGVRFYVIKQIAKQIAEIKLEEAEWAKEDAVYAESTLKREAMY